MVSCVLIFCSVLLVSGAIAAPNPVTFIPPYYSAGNPEVTPNPTDNIQASFYSPRTFIPPYYSAEETTDPSVPQISFRIDDSDSEADVDADVDEVAPESKPASE